MKKFKFFALAALTALLAACSSDDTVGLSNADEISDGTPRYIAVTIGNTGTKLSRAETYQQANPVQEEAISKIRFYFFDDAGNSVPVTIPSGSDFSPSAQTSSFCEVTAPTKSKKDYSGDTENLDVTYNAVMVISTDRGKKLPTNMVAVANIDFSKLPTGDNLTRSSLLSFVENYTVTNEDVEASTEPDKTEDLASGKSGLPMSSSVYSKNGEKQCEVSISDHLFSTFEVALANPVQVYIERVNAKVKLSTNVVNQSGNEEYIFPVQDPKNISTQYKIDLTPLSEEQRTQIQSTLGITGNQIDVYVQIHGWYVTGVMEKSFLFKSINSSWNASLLGSDTETEYMWNQPSRFRSFWAINPLDTENSNVLYPLKYYSYNDNRTEVTPSTDPKKYTENNTLATTNNSIYIQENSADDQDGSKSSELFKGANRNSKVFVKAQLMYKKSDNTFASLPYCEWASMKMPAVGDLLKIAMLSSMKSTNSLNYWTNSSLLDGKTTVEQDEAEGNGTLKDGFAKVTVGGTTTYYRQVSPADLEEVTSSSFNTGYQQNDVTKLVESKRYNSYLQLTSKSKGFTWVEITDETTAPKASSSEALNTSLKGNGGPVKYWKDGFCYYFFDIRHIGSDETNYKGYYGVVRNHIYDCSITNIAGLGTPVLNPDEIIIPEKPTDEATFLAAQINVLSWRVVSKTYVLGE